MKTAHRELMALAFEQGRVATPESDDAPEAGDKKEEYTAHLWGLFDEGQLRSSIEIRPFEVCWGTEDDAADGRDCRRGVVAGDAGGGACGRASATRAGRRCARRGR